MVVVALVAAGSLSSCSAYSSATHASSYDALPPYPRTSSHPSDAEQAATLAATVGYRHFLLAHSERLTLELSALAIAAAAGQLDAARSDELVAQGDFDALRGDLASYSATAVELDGERWSEGAARFGGLHAVERDLWGRHDELRAASLTAHGLVLTSLDTTYLFLRADLSPAQILGEAEGQLQWATAVPVAGREEEFSHRDLLDVDAAYGAAHTAVELTDRLSLLVAPSTEARASAALGSLGRTLAKLGDPASVVDASVPLATWQTIATELEAAAAPLGELQGDDEGFGSGRLYA